MAKNIYFIFIAILFIFLVFGLGASFAAERSYSIPSINMDLYLQADGTLHVKETIHYSFSGTFNGVYRDIPIRDQAKLENIKISTPGVYSNYNITDQGSNKHITIYLYSDPAKTIPISNRDVDIIIEYDFLNVIRFYNDMAELQYKLVGEGWAVKVGKVNAKVYFASSDGVKFWFNPPTTVANYSWQGNTLQLTSKEIRQGQFFEVRMAIPKNQFASNPPNVIYVDQDILPEMEKIEKEFQNDLNFRANVYSLITVLMLLACFIPLILYLKYGRDPKIDYNAEYERDIPTDDPPAVVNAISGKILGKEVGKPDMDGFRATILDLIRRDYLILHENHSNEDKHHSLSLKINRLEFNSFKDPVELWNFEIDIINFLSHFEEKDGLIYLDKFKKELKNRVFMIENSESQSGNEFHTFYELYKMWKKDVVNQFLNDERMAQLFIKKGDKYLKFFAGIGLIVSIFVFFASALDTLPEAKYALISSLILILVSLTSFIMPQKIAGHWTTYGEEYDAKWHNFAKYLQDFSLIKKYPPESIETWDKYLVYACALGIADKVAESMEMIIPQKEIGGNVYPFFYFGGYSNLSSGLNSGMSAAMGGAGGGGAGGGAGGGGGGAF